MDIDCDGTDKHAGSCAEDTTVQDETSFRNTVDGFGIPDLNSSIHSYVVFGNQDSRPYFDPRKVGMEPLGVMAVVCNDRLVSRLFWMVVILVMDCIADDNCSFMVSGVIRMEVFIPVKHRFLWLRLVFRVWISRGIMGIMNMTFCILGSWVKMLCLVQRVRIGRPGRLESLRPRWLRLEMRLLRESLRMSRSRIRIRGWCRGRGVRVRRMFGFCFWRWRCIS